MNTFPLNQLSQHVFFRTIQSMEIQDQLAYSLCSKNTKKAIKSLNLRAEKINLDVSDSIEIEISLKNSVSFWSFSKHGNTFPNNEFRTPEKIEICVSRDGVMSGWIWNFPNFEFKEWFHHFCEVLHHPRIDDFDLYQENLDDNYIEPIQKIIKGLRIGCLTRDFISYRLWESSTNLGPSKVLVPKFVEDSQRRYKMKSLVSLSDRVTPELAKKALESFPNYEQLVLFQVPFGNHKLDKILVQNLTSVFIPEAQRLNIDQILLTNSQRIQQNTSMFTEKDFNRLLKLWILGSNPNLRFYFTSGQLRLGKDSLDLNLISKGIKYEQVPLDCQEVYREKVTEHFYNETKLAGGSRIRSLNGTTAVIVVKENIFKFILEGVDLIYVF